MILPKFEYKKAQSIAGAIALYEGFHGKAQYLAGGTDLMPRLKLRLSAPAAVIDLKGIEEMSAISRQGKWFVVGANVTLFRLKNDPLVKEYFPALSESLDATSCETLQMRGTIGGNLLQDTRCLEYNQSLEWRKARGFCFKMGDETCNVVPAARTCFSNYCSDNAPSLISLSAQVKFAGPKGDRTARLEDIYSGDGRKPFLLEDGEILREISIPLRKTRGAYEKLRVRNAMDYPLVGVAVSLRGRAARVCVGGVGLVPRLYPLKATDENAVNDVRKKAYSDANPVANTTLSPIYRKRMVPVLLKRALHRVPKEGTQ